MSDDLTDQPLVFIALPDTLNAWQVDQRYKKAVSTSSLTQCQELFAQHCPKLVVVCLSDFEPEPLEVLKRVQTCVEPIGIPLMAAVSIATEINYTQAYELGLCDLVDVSLKPSWLSAKIQYHLDQYEQQRLIETSHEQLLNFNVDLLRQQEIMMAVADLATELTFYWEIEGKFGYISPYCETLLGYSQAQLMAQPSILLSRVADSDIPLWNELFSITNAEQLKNCPVNERTKSHEIYLHPKQGVSLRVRAATCPVFNGRGRLLGFRGVIKNITEMHKMHVDLREARVQAEAANQAKSTFLTTMSHELRTPLNGILGVLDVLAHCQLSDDQQPMVGTAKKSALTLLELIESILSFVQADSEKQKKKQRISLRALMQSLLVEVEDKVKAAGIELVYQANFEQDLVEVDADTLKNLLGQLLDNAIKFTGEGQKVVVKVDQQDRLWRFSIQDTGIGIAEHHLDKVFDPFFQVDQGDRRQFGGAGFGLAFCRQLAERLGGRIDVVSELGVGSCFTLVAPLMAGHYPRIHCLDWQSEGFSCPLAYTLQKQLEHIGYEVLFAQEKTPEAVLEGLPANAFMLVYVRYLDASTAKTLLEKLSALADSQGDGSKESSRTVASGKGWVAVEQCSAEGAELIESSNFQVMVLPMPLEELKRQALDMERYSGSLAAKAS